VLLGCGEFRNSIWYAGAVMQPEAHNNGLPLPEYTEDGVDISLIRWTISLTPLERLRFLEDRIRDVLAIRELNART
jgi:hypothetical protein